MGTLINRDGNPGERSNGVTDTSSSFGYIKPLEIPKNRGCEICKIK